MKNKDQVELQQQIDDLRIAIAHFVEDYKKISKENDVLKRALQNASYSIADKNLVKERLDAKVLEIYTNLVSQAKIEEEQNNEPKEK